jgi:hypothetical protein
MSASTNKPNTNTNNTQTEATKTRTRHPSLATIAAKKEFKKVPLSTPSPTLPHQLPTYISTPQREQRETEVFKRIEREIEEKELQLQADEDVLLSVEKELFG